MDSLIFAPGWVHLGLLSTFGLVSLLWAVRAQRAGVFRIARGLIALSCVQIAVAGLALAVTYLVGTSLGWGLGCWIGFAGYALCGIAAFTLMFLSLWTYGPRHHNAVCRAATSLQGSDLALCCRS